MIYEQFGSESAIEAVVGIAGITKASIREQDSASTRLSRPQSFVGDDSPEGGTDTTITRSCPALTRVATGRFGETYV